MFVGIVQLKGKVKTTPQQLPSCIDTYPGGKDVNTIIIFSLPSGCHCSLDLKSMFVM